VIDATILGVRIDFEEMGIEQNVLEALQQVPCPLFNTLVTLLTRRGQSWEAKLAQSNVADFTTDARMAPFASNPVPQPYLPDTDEDDEAAKVSKAVAASAKGKAQVPQGDEIGSDLDDSDEEELENEAVDEAGESGDLIIALYDKVGFLSRAADLPLIPRRKVNRVKNKWKVSLRDGVVNVKGKDILFSKCQGCVAVPSSRILA
jgi:transcription initiation factor TFIIA large subunit